MYKTIENYNKYYQGFDGISLGIFFVLHGASNPDVQFLPKIPPRTVNGNPTKTIMNRKIKSISV